MTTALPGSIAFIERDWLSANHIMFRDGDAATLVDTGYGKFNDVTIDHVERTLDGWDGAPLRAHHQHPHPQRPHRRQRCAAAGCTEVAASRFRRRNSSRW